MEISKLITQLRNKCVPEVKEWVRQWVKDHIIDEVDPDDVDF